MKISLYSPPYINEIGKRDNQEDALSLWENRLFVFIMVMSKKESRIFFLNWELIS